MSAVPLRAAAIIALRPSSELLASAVTLGTSASRTVLSPTSAFPFFGITEGLRSRRRSRSRRDPDRRIGSGDRAPFFGGRFQHRRMSSEDAVQHFVDEGVPVVDVFFIGWDSYGEVLANKEQ